jgi:heptose-I-phosphate ethanolaminephosphotransferase
MTYPIKKARISAVFLTGGVTYALLTLLRCVVASGSINLLMQQGYMILSVISFVLACWVLRFNKKALSVLVGSITLYASVLYIKHADGMIILDRETVHTVTFGIVVAALIVLTLKASALCRRAYCALPLRLFGAVAAAVYLFIPLLFWGYFIVSGGHLLSADILLTLFQTNPEETRAYLQEQNLWLWGVCLTFLIGVPLVVAVAIFLKSKAFQGDKNSVKGSAGLRIVLTGAVALYLAIGLLPKLKSCFVLDTLGTVRATLESFRVYEQTKGLRAERLEALKQTLKADAQDGVYLLVVGESTARDHMSAFGYKRRTTPWLDKMSRSAQAVLFSNAYSNHVHTVPAVQYSLTELNQYAPVEVSEAYSVVEVAKAAGYTTYWISNQKQFNVADTPLTTIAASADHQIWLNTYSGDKTMTTYYDDKLAEVLPSVEKAEKALIVVHLMGCHAVYIERYPSDYNIFDDGNVRVDTYDNSILFNDHTLESLYEKIKENPKFMAMIYYSDHGEDPDRGYTHEASKFTYEMSRIPLVMLFSERFIKTREETFEILRSHQNAYVTSDLFYNTVVGMLGLKGLPRPHDDFDLSSPRYDRKPENLLTVHGVRPISGDPHIKKGGNNESNG